MVSMNALTNVKRTPLSKRRSAPLVALLAALFAAIVLLVVAVESTDAKTSPTSGQEVWAWGDNFRGQLGNGTNTSSNTPVQVSNLSGVTAVAGCGGYSLAVVPDTTVPDTIAPKVISVKPTEDATRVARGVDVTATFSEDMLDSSINTTTFELFRIKKRSTTKIDATVSYDATTRTATLNPFGSSTTLLARGTYKAVVTTGAKDLAGNQLDQDDAQTGLQQKEWSFRVR
jgi:hypothetical protein